LFLSASLIKGKDKLIFLILRTTLLCITVLYLVEKALVQSLSDDFMFIKLRRYSTVVQYLIARQIDTSQFHLLLVSCQQKLLLLLFVKTGHILC